MEENKIVSNVFDIKDIFEVLNAIVDECRIYILEDRWKVSIIDPANVASITIDIPKEDFHDYNIKTPFIVELDTVEILNILDDKEGYQMIEIFIEPTYEDKKEMYKIKFKIDDIIHSFISPKLEGMAKRVVPVSTKDNVELSVSLKHFYEIIKSCADVSDYVIFENKDGKIRIHSEDVCKNVEAFIGNNITENVKSMISLDYLKKIIKRINKRSNGIITLYLGVEWPITIKFNICRYGKGTCVIVPRIYHETDMS